MASAALRPLPDFLVIGAKRSGTTSLHNWLLAHPDVLPLFPSARRLPLRADIKGVHHFDAAPMRSVWWYRSHFPSSPGRALAARRAGGARVVAGEATPYYLHHPHAPARAAAVVPDARLIVLLRDPVERAWSHWKEQRRRGFEPLATFEEAIDAEPGRLAGEAERLAADPAYRSFAHEHQSYVTTGRYLEPLARWQAAFPPEQLLVLRSEDAFADPKGTFAVVLDFLGLRPARLAEDLRPDTAALEAHLGRSFGWTSSPPAPVEVPAP